MPHSARLYRATASFESFEHAQAAYQDRKALKSHSAINRLFPAEAAMGGHEVIIESPRHTESLGELNTAEVALVFAAYSQRIRYWREVPGVQHVSIFKNVGRDAGASLLHSHSQLIATNRVPTVVQLVTRRLQAHHARLGSCLQCDLLRGELEQESRVISQTDSFVAYCPFASRFPLQVRVTSKEHLPCFSDLRTQPLAELARLTLRVVRWLEALRPGTAYNMLIHNCPVDFRGARESQHWAMDIFPRVSRLAGFELATGAMINPVYPETAAKAYRAQARLSDPRYVLR
jgi:UDPglucose--hexose-1-phosphate uridylyltransferase